MKHSFAEGGTCVKQCFFQRDLYEIVVCWGTCAKQLFAEGLVWCISCLRDLCEAVFCWETCVKHWFVEGPGWSNVLPRDIFEAVMYRDTCAIQFLRKEKIHKACRMNTWDIQNGRILTRVVCGITRSFFPSSYMRLTISVVCNHHAFDISCTQKEPVNTIGCSHMTRIT